MNSLICDKLRSEIESGTLCEGGRLPGFRVLAERYDCSRGTIENAVGKLSEEGLLRTIHGRGTFLSSSPVRKKREMRRIVGAVLLRNSWMEAMEKLRSEFLSDGWFVSTYCAGDDLQDPAAEAVFLRNALAQNFAAVILVGTPYEPLNTELYREMRQEGMKVLHLTHYKYDMSGEASILPDYRAAGGLAVSAAAMNGFKKLVYMESPSSFLSPSTILRREGVMETAKGLSLPLTETTEFPERIPSGTALLCETEQYLLRLKETGMDSSVIALGGTFANAKFFNRITFDFQESLRFAMKYISDETIAPTDPFVKNLNPFFLKKEGEQNI